MRGGTLEYVVWNYGAVIIPVHYDTLRLDPGGDFEFEGRLATLKGSQVQDARLIKAGEILPQGMKLCGRHQ